MECCKASEVPEAQNDKHEQMTVVFASHVYVLMKKKTRVSRNLRACWFFRHLCSHIKFTPLTTLEDLEEDLNLVSVIPQDPDQKLEHGLKYDIYIGPDTVVTFLSWQYRLAFVLDLSPSLMSVDVETGQYVYDGIFQSLSRCLHGLVTPFPIPGSKMVFTPDLYISVIIQTPVVCSTTNQVLIQGVKINEDNVNDYLDHIKYELDQFEASLSLSFASMLSHHHPRKGHSPRCGEEGNKMDMRLHSGDNIGSPEAAFTNILRYGILSLQLLPNNSSSGIVVITDGIIGLPSSYMIELLLEQLRNHTIMCSFIKVGSPSSLYRQLGRVPHIEMMQTIATATFGAVLSSGPGVNDKFGEANQYHRAMMFWAFQKGLEGFKYDLTHHSDEDMPGSISWIRKMLHRHPITGSSFGTELYSRERDKRKVRAGLGSVLSVRLREGYTIKSISFPKDNKEITVKLQFPWRDYGKIEYAATSPWPLSPTSHSTQVEVSVEGSYDLLHELLCKNGYERKSPYRDNNIKTLWTIIEKISATDEVLAHLQSFTSEPQYYQVPEGIRSGVPLFYMQPDGPALNMQLKECNVTRFAAFWKEVIQLDTNNWQKWLHSHRIGLIMEHDRQLPKYFQVPNPSSRFTSIQCRQSLASLSLMLREWSTFVLAEDHSYIKLLYKEGEKTPRFFCVLRLTHNLPTMVMRLGFQGGTPGHIRSTELQNLQEKIQNLHFPQRGSQKPTKKIHDKTEGGAVEVLPPRKSPLNREGSEIFCCVLMTKPFEKILINYEGKPCNMKFVNEPGKEGGCGSHCQPQQHQSAMWSMFRTITHYLQHQRWVWEVQAGPKAHISMTAISRMLVTITKLRLQEGFNILSSGAGVTNLVVEVDMKESADASDDGDNIQTCVVQYVIFPPHIKNIDDGDYNDDEKADGEMREYEEEIQLVTECWVEPQYGVSCHNPPERKHFDGLSYESITRAFFPYDQEIVSSLSTFQHLVYLCENKAIPSHDLVSSRQSSPPSTPGHRFAPKKEESIRSEPTVNFIPFPFDLMSILPRSQQGELLFSSFVIGNENEEVHHDVAMEPNEVLFSLFYDKLKESHDNEILVSADDCHRFMYHILQRQRDHKANPVPFAYHPDSCCDRDFHVSTSLESDSPFFKHTSANKQDGCSCHGDTKSPNINKSPDKGSSTSTYVTAPACESSPHRHYCRHSRHSRSSDDTTKHSRKSDSSHCPLWKCYLKLENPENPDHMLLTFVPSSFEDLLLLNPVKVGAAKNDDSKVCSDFKPDMSKLDLDVTANNTDGSLTQDGKLDSLGGDKSQAPSSQTDRASRPVDLSLSIPDNTATTNTSTSDKARDTFLSPTETSNEKVQKWMITHTETVKPKVKGALVVPVYTYSCQLKNITTSLTDRWSFSLPEDLFDDMSFKPESATGLTSPRAFMQPSQSSADDKERMGRHSGDRRSTDSFSYRLEAFKEHGHYVSELFLSSYVTGVYQSLQNDHTMSPQDVDAAINNICEESQLLEMDMTSYLTATCSHLQHLVHKARVKVKQAEESKSRMDRHEDDDSGVIFHRQQSIRFDDDVAIGRDEEHSHLPEILQLPPVVMDLANEDGDKMSPHQCRNVKEQSGTVENVQSRFETVVSKNFRAIQSLPDFFFYCPNRQMATGDLDVTADKLEDTEFITEDQAVETGADEDEDIIMTTSVPGDEVINTSMASNMDNSSLGSSFDGSSSTNCVDVDKEPVPLFVHLTCTVRQRSNSQHVSVRTVPLCFGEIVRELTEQLEFIDFSDFKVTLDITCLTLVGEDDEDQVSFPRKRLLSRCLSVASQQSEVEEDVEEMSTVHSVPMHQRIGDPVGHLSKSQTAAIQELKEGIEWLLQEEIISSLRKMFPISADTLTFVADHIKSPGNIPSTVLPQTSLSECVELQFVHGPEQSHKIFIEEIERQDLGEYRLTREGDFYFVILNKGPSRHLYYHHIRPHRTRRPSERKESHIESNHSADQVIVDRDERSSSLPCVLSGQPLEDGQALLLTSRSLTQSRTDGETMGELNQAQINRRRCSDEKSTESARSDDPSPVGIGVHTNKAVRMENTSLEDVQALETRPDSPCLQINKLGDNSLKKSSSFAGLQGSQFKSPNTSGSASRHRHCSAPSGRSSQALRTGGIIFPQSPSIISSRASTATDDGEGFEGDVSDNDMDDMTSMSVISIDSPDLPNFWLLMQIHGDGILFFFHSRTPIDEGNPSSEEQKKLYQLIKENAQQLCTKVNQTLLLRDLYKTKMCNPFLVPEADEDSWPNRRTRTTSYGYGMYEDDDNEENQNIGYLYASMNLQLSPGLFACPVMWRCLFPLHPRLKVGRQKREPTLGLLTLQGVLEKFSVLNRRNMFVMEETLTQNVYYVRLKEVQKNPETNEIDLDASLSDSTYLSLSKSELQIDSDTVSLTSNMSRQTSRVDDFIELFMYGVEEPGKEFIDGLQQVLQNRMDETLLNAVTVPLSRNPQCKLKPEDISFIQRPYTDSMKTLRLTIPSYCSMYLVALMYYLRQNLLLFLHKPNYADNNNPLGHFQDKYDGIWKAIPSHKVFLYNRPAVGGGKGLACISMDLVDGMGQQVKLLNCPSPARYNAPVVDVSTKPEFENLVNTNVHEPSTSARSGPGPTALIQFKIWVCGNCDVPFLCERLQSSVRHAVCDIIMEYYMLTYPICWVPSNLLDVSAPPVSSLPSSPTKLPDDEGEGGGEEDGEGEDVVDRGVNPLNRKLSVEPPKSVTHEKNFFLRFERLTGSKTSSAGKCLDFSQAPPEHSPTPHSQSSSRQSSVTGGIPSQPGEDVTSSQERQKVVKYEEGETGNLHRVFCRTMEPWMSFCHEIGVPSMTKVSFQFQSRFCMDFVMKELLQSIPTISPDTTLRVFKVRQNPSGDSPHGILFTPCKRSNKDSNTETLIQKFSAAGVKMNMLAIGRNLEQWQTMIQDDPNSRPTIGANILRAYRKSQRFMPQVLDESEGQKDQKDTSHSKSLMDQKDSSLFRSMMDQADPSCVEKQFVPRQKLLIILCEKKELTLLLYNWASDMASQVEKTVGRLIQWNNARSHILDSIVAQKMGLFHHMTFSDLSHSVKQNPYTQSVAEVESLIRHHAPSKDYQRRHSSLSQKEKTYPHSRKHIVPFDQTYKNLCPPKALDRLLCSLSSDPVCRHGLQAQEIRLSSRQDKSQAVGASGRKDPADEKVSVSSIQDQVFQHGFQLLDTQKICMKEEERSTLRQLYYMGWSQANSESHSNHPVMEEYLMQLKRTGRLFHYCATPMVFCAKWRHNVVHKTVGRSSDGPRTTQPTEMSTLSILSLNNATTSTVINSSQATTPATPDKSHKTRSRHSSGTSIISGKGGKMSETAESSRKGSLSENVGPAGPPKGKPEMEKEESWHYELRRRFIQEYTDYLVTELDFILFNVKPSLAKRHDSNAATNQKSENGSELTFNLQKTLAGGIILMELSFRQEYFCVNMYSVDCSQLQVIVIQEEQINFINECDAYKDLIHVHSFAHDFHLRCVQSYLSKESSTFPSGFDLDCFLTDFKQVYPYSPSFSRNCILEDAICLQELPFPGHMLYEYMLKHMGLQDMTMIRVVGDFSSIKIAANKFALVQLQLLNVPPLTDSESPNKTKTSMTNSTTISSHENGKPSNRDSGKECEPYHASLVIINNSKSSEQDDRTLDLKFFTVLTRERNCHPRLQLEKVPSNAVGDATSAGPKKPIEVMRTKREHHINYRGYSNQHQLALHKVLNSLNDQGRSNIEEMVEMSKMKCRRDYLWKRLLHSDTEDSQVLNALKYTEFCELLEAVTITPLNKADPRLSPLFNMPMAWYRLLVSVLMTKYREDHCIRIFESEGKKRYIVILNSNNLDMFAMLGLMESMEQIELCIVMKEPLADVSHHSPETPNLPLYSLQTHLEDFVNVCCFHMWSSML